jgi:hypothetical protein
MASSFPSGAGAGAAARAALGTVLLALACLAGLASASDPAFPGKPVNHRPKDPPVTRP